jgi:hypothetical protein
VLVTRCPPIRDAGAHPGHRDLRTPAHAGETVGHMHAGGLMARRDQLDAEFLRTALDQKIARVGNTEDRLDLFRVKKVGDSRADSLPGHCFPPDYRAE